MCLAVTCHLHLWQNDQDLLHASAVTQVWNGYWNKIKSQHKKFNLEKKIILPLLQELEPTTFQSQVQRNHWTSPVPANTANAILSVSTMLLLVLQLGAFSSNSCSLPV